MQGCGRRPAPCERRIPGGEEPLMAVTQDRYCAKCRKKVRMTRCEVCRGTGGGLSSQCNKACNRKGWLCPRHGKWY